MENDNKLDTEMNGDEKVLSEIKTELKELRSDVNRLLNFEQFKKDAKANFINWVRMGILLIPLGIGAVGWLAYETGLYKPVPTHSQQVKK